MWSNSPEALMLDAVLAVALVWSAIYAVLLLDSLSRRQVWEADR